jgi:hypothetical protein
MTMAVVAVGVGAAGVATGIAGSVLGAHAAENAADTQAAAARDANATQLQMFTQTRDDLLPYREFGKDALQRLYMLSAYQPTVDPYSPTPAYDPRATPYSPTPAYDPRANPYSPTPAYDPRDNPYSPTPAYSGPTEAELHADPGYQFRVAEGQKALERSAAGKGLLLSGGQLKDLTRFGQEMGAQEYGAAYARGYQKNQDVYGRTLATNALTDARAYRANADVYARTLATNELTDARAYRANADVYGRTLATNELAYGRDYQHNADVYGRNLEAYQTGYNTLMGLRKNQVGELAGVAGAGQGAVNTLGQMSQQTGAQLAQTTIGAGNAQAAGQVGAANAWNAGLGSVAGAGNQYMNYQLLSSLARGNQGNLAGAQSDIYQRLINNPELY